MEVPNLTIFCREGRPPADDLFAHSGCPQVAPDGELEPCDKIEAQAHVLAEETGEWLRFMAVVNYL
jgi:hypothetical protein